MRIYHCTRIFMGRELNAVVVAVDGVAARDLLDWEIDEDTTNITCISIGEALVDIPKVYCEESL